jgi:hypothetical protein
MAGAAGRLRMIEEEFAVTSKHSPYVDTLNRLRNCLTHRRDVVTEKDCSDSAPQGLHVRYLRFQAQVQQPNQEPVAISAERVEPLLVKEGGSIGYQIVEADRLFPLGSAVTLSNPDIGDVLFTVWNVGLELKGEPFKHIRGRGLEITEK